MSGGRPPTPNHGSGPVVSVLIVNFRSTRLLERCLRSLERSTTAGQLEIIVVDNATPGFDVADLQVRHPLVALLPQITNTTFTGGNNIAFERATGTYVLLLNPDTEVEPDAIRRAIVHFQENPGLVGQGAYLLDGSGSLQRYYRRLPRAIDIPVVLLERLFRRTGIGRRYTMAGESFEGETAVGQPPGAFLITRRQHSPSPILDPGYSNFFSDVELCDRLWRTGAIAVFDDVRCAHGRGLAGVRTSDVAEQLRLYQDLTWGVRHYFRTRTSLAGRAYIEAWLVIFWLARVVQTAVRRPRFAGHAVTVATAALRGDRPRYD